MKVDELTMLDITAPEHGVDVQIDSSGSVLWVNVDGVCRLRICKIPQLQLTDNRKEIVT